MGMLELCSSLCELSSMTDTPREESMACPRPNPFVISELSDRYPRMSLWDAELKTLSQLSTSASDLNNFLDEGVSECAFLAIMKLPDGGGLSHYISDNSMSSYFYEIGNKVLNYTFTTPTYLEGISQKRSLTFSTILDNPGYSLDAMRGNRTTSQEKAAADVYHNNVRIRRSECIGAVIMGECKGSVINSGAPRKRCHGTVLNGQCIGAEF